MFIAIVLLGLGAAVAWASIVPIPSINNFENRKVAESTKIFDRTGNTVLYDVHGSVRRTAVPLTSISPYIQKATISIEDAQFYSHHGFRPTAFLRAIYANLTSGSLKEGGSTITQQVIKNALLTQDKTVVRKLEEIVLALRLEQIYTKDQILETYLNENNYGGTIYGVQEATQYFFGVDANAVDLAQAAYIAALPQAPTHLSPYGPNKAELDDRKNLVLARMKDNGYITDKEYQQAKQEKVQFRNETEAGIKAPHFVFYVRDYLEQKYGVDMVENGGLRVITSIDSDLQQKAEDIVAKYAAINEKQFNASNAGLVAIDPKTGQILAMVGSRNYFDTQIDGAVNVTLADRQPGSSFKPFVYATALEKGYTPDTVVFDLQTQFSTACQPTDVANDTPPCYSPSNYDGNFKGPMTFRDALAQSQNVPAVKVLYLAGIKDSIKTAQDLGITTLGNADQYGLTLVLGGGEVNLLDMTGAYSVFANDGVKNPPTGILRVEDKNGNILEEYKQNSTQVLDPQIARQINDMLSDNNARIPEFGVDSPLNFSGYDVADKTGTTNDFRDVWVIGYTPSFASGAWAGNNDNSPMEKKIAAFIVAPMWHEFMVYALGKYSSASDTFPQPSPDPNYNSLPPVLRGEWNANPSLGIHEILYWVHKDNPRAGNGGDTSDSQFAYWEYPVQLWTATQGMPTTGESSFTTPQQPQQTQTPQNRLTFTSPNPNTIIPWGVPINVAIAFPSGVSISRVTYYLNNIPIQTVDSAPFNAQLQPNQHGPAYIRAIADTPNGPIEGDTVVNIQ